MPHITTPEIQQNPLSPEQEIYKQFGLTHPKCGLWLDMGCGKTRITLEILLEKNPNHHVLIVAPKTIARSVWIDEIRKWGLPFRTQSLIVNERGKQLTMKKRHEIYETIPTAKPTVYFINRELIVDLVNYFATKKPPIWWFPTIVLDEAQAFKGYKSERFKALKKVQPILQNIIELTGTPKPRGLEDIWPQIYLLDGGLRLGPNITTFRSWFMRPTFVINNHPVGYMPLPGAEPEVYRRINDLVISGRNTSVTMPTLNMQTIYAHMTQNETKIYKRMMKDYVYDTASGDIVTADTAATLQMKLAQMASGSLYIEKGTTKYEIIHMQKLDICKYIIDNTSTPVLIAYHFKSDNEMLMQYFSSNGYNIRTFDKTPEMIDEWNQGKIPIMLIQPASAGHGLNLQHGGHDLIWYTLPFWALEEYLQTNARLYRRGQKYAVNIWHILTKGTIDARILKGLNLKDVSQKELLDSVDKIYKNPSLLTQIVSDSIDMKEGYDNAS